MPTIIREDGERFVIPSYRDTVSAKKTSLLKKEIMLLSTSYGEYITIRKKTAIQYEVAFAPESGYLLGECVWDHFKRPYDMVYCERIPNSAEAILVIVKAGSVYLDGSFPVDSIAEELVVFKTQQNNFNVYIYGDVPISQVPAEGKFTLDTSSVKSFTVLDTPAFPAIKPVKMFQLQLVTLALASQGIGVLPIKKIVTFALILGLLYMAYQYLSSHKKELPAMLVPTVIIHEDPYKSYNEQLSTPDPKAELLSIMNCVNMLYTIPGWVPGTIEYTPGTLGKIRASVKSEGAKTDLLYAWAYKHNADIEVLPDGFYVSLIFLSRNRPPPLNIYHISDLMSHLADTFGYILPGNPLQFSAPVDKKVFKQSELTIAVPSVTFFVFNMIGEYLEGLPLVLTKVSLTTDHQMVSGSIVLTMLGN